MLKKLVPLFLVILLAGVFLPLVSLAAEGNTYEACQLDASGKCVTTYTVCYSGIVPCGKKVCVGSAPTWNKDSEVCESCDQVELSANALPCQFCHLFIMIDGIVDYVLIMIVPSLTLLILVVGGIMFYFGGAKPELLSKSKTLFKGVVIGLILIYGAYMIVGIALTILGVADVNPMRSAFDSNKGVFKIDCRVTLPPVAP